MEEAATGSTQFLSFVLDDEVFGLEISRVREVLELDKITKVPQTPEFMRGVINLRGSVVPVMDLRLKFGLGETPTTIDTCIIIAEIELEGEMTLIGALADSVEEVFELDQKMVEPPPRMGNRLKTDFIKGMGKREDGFILLLDIQKVFALEELELITQAGHPQEED